VLLEVAATENTNFGLVLYASPIPRPSRAPLQGLERTKEPLHVPSRKHLLSSAARVRWPRRTSLDANI